MLAHGAAPLLSFFREFVQWLHQIPQNKNILRDVLASIAFHVCVAFLRHGWVVGGMVGTGLGIALSWVVGVGSRGLKGGMPAYNPTIHTFQQANSG